MGRTLVALLPEFPGLTLHAAIVEPGTPQAGTAVEDAPGVRYTTDLAAALSGARLVIDFSSAAAASGHVQACAAARVPLLLGTTGAGATLEPVAAQAAQQTALLIAANTSIGIALLTELVQRAAAVLPARFDVEIIEAHHRHKVDAPSGTALVLGEAAATGRGRRLESCAEYARHGAGGPRASDGIGFAVVRGGDVVGEHEVLFLGPGERVALKHSATDRSIFARGALAAGRWLADQPPGRYEMRDFLK
ncbi:MAG: 4-hydroxy-tetrahydrodipicolinate reductase [Gammaproteobacteria bacterium]|nr:4-hydroxy-tetrahydrodipicolinate reductase [Gammaproteobacteria bacterium]